LLDQALKLALELQEEAGKPLKTWVPAMEQSPKVAELREAVKAFATQFPLPGSEY
jgi:glycine hydroxymethyltransferase